MAFAIFSFLSTMLASTTVCQKYRSPQTLMSYAINPTQNFVFLLDLIIRKSYPHVASASDTTSDQQFSFSLTSAYALRCFLLIVPVHLCKSEASFPLPTRSHTNNSSIEPDGMSYILVYLILRRQRILVIVRI